MDDCAGPGLWVSAKIRFYELNLINKKLVELLDDIAS